MQISLGYAVHFKNKLRLALLFVAMGVVSPLLWSSKLSAADNLQLPQLGQAGSEMLSVADEYRLGQSLVRYYRASMRTSHDAFLQDYLRQLLNQIATYSDLQDKRLELLVLNNPSLNAFAAPGGIVGINTGTLLIAENEQQLSSIVAHELAHLSQRHYARRLQKQKTAGLASATALIASILVAATSDNGDAIAAIPAIQAASIESSLRFSREMEAEADRIGMQTMINAGLNPYAMPQMFELMLRRARFRTKVPEFLLTHPLTESRVSDSMARARRYPERPQPIDLNYQLVRSRVILFHEDSPQKAAKRFASELQGNQMPEAAARYGLILALTETGELEQAQSELNRLKSSIDAEEFIAVAQADILAKQQDYQKAAEELERSLSRHPNSHPLNQRLAEILMESGQYIQCEQLLEEHVKRQPDNDYIWYLLAEVHGLAGHILDVHKARAEYFILNGVYDKAEIQLRNALKLAKNEDFQTKAKLEQRLLDVKNLQKNSIFR